MTKSDGTVMVEAIYDYEKATGRNMLYITLGGVTLSFNLNTQEPGELSDADQQKLDAWATSQDATLVQDASASIITDGSQQADPEILLNYYGVAMLVDFTPPTASIPKKQIRGKNALHHAVGTLMADTASFLCGNDLINRSRIRPTPGRTKTSIGVGTPLQCFGCCGLGCACIRDRGGNAIYGEPCRAHDACVGQYGYTSSNCRRAFVIAVIYTYWRILK
jgi:hypothetical protein